MPDQLRPAQATAGYTTNFKQTPFRASFASIHRGFPQHRKRNTRVRIGWHPTTHILH